MPNFIDCWAALKAKGYKHADGSEVLNEHDKSSIMDRIQEHLKTGLDPLEAAKASVQSHLDEASAQLQSIYDQAGVKPFIETAPAAEKPPVQTTPETPATQTGISNERFQEQYGDQAPVSVGGRGPAEWKSIGQTRLNDFQRSGAPANDPYAVLTNLREGKVPVSQMASDVSLLRAEHQRLYEDAIRSEGTPEYAAKADAAQSMAQAIKEVAHGPSSDVFRALQEYDQPRYDNLTDFDQAIRERMGRESTEAEKKQFSKIVKDRVETRDASERAVIDAQNRVQKFRPKEKLSFEDAAKDIHDQITKFTKDCIL